MPRYFPTIHLGLKIQRSIRVCDHQRRMFEVQNNASIHPSISCDTSKGRSLFDKWNTHPSPLPKCHILIPEKSHKQLLLPINPPTKELPQHNHVAHQTDRIPTHELRAHCPPEITEVARVTQMGVHTGGNKRVGGLLGVCYDM
jgi:hypothetical protein